MFKMAHFFHKFWPIVYSDILPNLPYMVMLYNSHEFGLWNIEQFVLKRWHINHLSPYLGAVKPL